MHFPEKWNLETSLPSNLHERSRQRAYEDDEGPHPVHLESHSSQRVHANSTSPPQSTWKSFCNWTRLDTKAEPPWRKKPERLRILAGKFSFKKYSFEIFRWFIKNYSSRSLKDLKNLPSCWYIGTHPERHAFYHNCWVIEFQLFMGKEIRLTYKKVRSGSQAWLPSSVLVLHLHLPARHLSLHACGYPKPS